MYCLMYCAITTTISSSCEVLQLYVQHQHSKSHNTTYCIIDYARPMALDIDDL